MDNISEVLKQQAISLGACKKEIESWSDLSQQELIDKYRKCLDFCVSRQYPSNEFIKANFSRKLLNDNLIFVDEHIELDNALNGVYIINGECSGNINFPQWSAATVYIRHSSRVEINVGDFGKVFVRLYDDAEVDTTRGENAICRVYDRRG